METRENILKELNELAPTLAKMEKKNFYSVPENYFANFKSEVLEQVKLSEVKQELKTIAPELANLKREVSSPLLRRGVGGEVEIPANYFSAFPQQMLKRIAAEHKAKEISANPKWMEALSKVLENVAAVIFKPKYSFAFAGMAAIVIVAGMFFTKVEQECNDLDCKMAKLSNDEINAYLDANEEGSSEEIFELNQEADLSSIDNNAFKNALNNVSDEELNNAILD